MRSDSDQHLGAAAGALGRGRRAAAPARPRSRATWAQAAPLHGLGAQLGQAPGAVVLEAREEVGGDREAQDARPPGTRAARRTRRRCSTHDACVNACRASSSGSSSRRAARVSSGVRTRSRRHGRRRSRRPGRPSGSWPPPRRGCGRRSCPRAPHQLDEVERVRLEVLLEAGAVAGSGPGRPRAPSARCSRMRSSTSSR